MRYLILLCLMMGLGGCEDDPNYEPHVVCRAGYKFAKDYQRSTQIFDDQGHGIKCN